MIRCTGDKCKLHSDKNNCKHRDHWGICKLSELEFAKYAKCIVTSPPIIKENSTKKETKAAKE